ncbi:GNAT family N-acetyltransferase [Roseobacter sp. YSTF-M11]|uniref:GNAT family N-acetyltransferase n=1 Tax=Roseobacter insulae TaxID=2859783 RepID=A0A9X1JXE0_9RHOB|nr:GNAT family N-acetyltransferase [Roseobacter insulae]MBW4707115.1 GNAT family N-acetyltransferase [Roseobacter insulae]
MAFDVARALVSDRAMLNALIDAARDMGVQRLFLETGSGPEHHAARKLYQSAGFTICAPFGDYTVDPLSVFMSRPV